MKESREIIEVSYKEKGKTPKPVNWSWETNSSQQRSVCGEAWSMVRDESGGEQKGQGVEEAIFKVIL